MHILPCDTPRQASLSHTPSNVIPFRRRLPLFPQAHGRLFFCRPRALQERRIAEMAAARCPHHIIAGVTNRSLTEVAAILARQP
jgi:hypothetical protein